MRTAPGSRAGRKVLLANEGRRTDARQNRSCGMDLDDSGHWVMAQRLRQWQAKPLRTRALPFHNHSGGAANHRNFKPSPGTKAKRYWLFLDDNHPVAHNRPTAHLPHLGAPDRPALAHEIAIPWCYQSRAQTAERAEQLPAQDIAPQRIFISNTPKHEQGERNRTWELSAAVPASKLVDSGLWWLEQFATSFAAANNRRRSALELISNNPAFMTRMGPRPA